MTFMQQMGSDGLVPERIAANWQPGHEVKWFLPWTGAKMFGSVEKIDTDKVVIKSALTRYQYEIVRN